MSMAIILRLVVNGIVMCLVFSVDFIMKLLLRVVSIYGSMDAILCGV